MAVVNVDVSIWT